MSATLHSTTSPYVTAVPARICAPTRLEERALRSARTPTTRCGVGAGNASRAVAHGPLAEAGALAVAGICGGLDPDLRTGDVVVADRLIRDGQTTVSLPSARMLAARLRREGLRVHVGAIAGVDHVAQGAEREELHAQGALAVDMESAWLVTVDRPAAVVRVVADTADRPVLRPATLRSVRSALATLRRIGPALDEWAAAVAPSRTVLLAEPRSFCAGVDRAIEVVERALELRGAPVYVRKQIVHNRHVVDNLERRGAVFVEDLDEVPEGATVVFSAHGVSPAVRERAGARELDVIDATCPLVSKVHSEVRRFSDRGDTVIFIGHAGHEETEGTMGERPQRTVLVENAEDASRVEIEDPEHVSYLVQTTLSVREVDEIVEVLRNRFPKLKAPASDDICYATTNRQEALTTVATESDVVLVVGSQNSSNSQRLVETSRRLGTQAYLVDDVDDVELGWLAGATTVGLTAGASAPQALVDELVDAVGGLGSVEVHTRHLVTEDVQFTLPKEVRTA
ncbi:MAG TPA: 4-hydroxy-3-methylbut-2-enyl diphosphate reductase [Nocardioidaceae bacterium]|nr:4-hydroxy-3-methylbut-2-enyl diphosphate reductase [Nocardioidaceae bacterium]